MFVIYACVCLDIVDLIFMFLIEVRGCVNFLLANREHVFLLIWDFDKIVCDVELRVEVVDVFAIWLRQKVELCKVFVACNIFEIGCNMVIQRQAGVFRC